MEMKSSDPARQRVFEFLQAWFLKHGSQPTKTRNLDPEVSAVLGASRQGLTAFVCSLEGARVGGFVLTVAKPAGKWGTADYTVHRAV
jgi:hypothetical protein